MWLEYSDAPSSLHKADMDTRGFQINNIGYILSSLSFGILTWQLVEIGFISYKTTYLAVSLDLQICKIGADLEYTIINLKHPNRHNINWIIYKNIGSRRKISYKIML